MAGGGGGSRNFGKPGSGGGGAGGSGGVDCSKIRFEVLLQSPKPPASKLKVGDRLSIEAKESTSVVAINSSGQVVGAILHSSLLDLINCLAGGTKYNATVLEIDDGAIKVRVCAE